MRTISAKLFFVIAFAFVSFTANAQFGTGIGVRYGTDANIGLTVLQFFGDRNQGAANFIVSAPYGGFRASGCFEIHLRNHNEKIEVAGVGFFIGAGGHIGRYKTQLYRKNTTTHFDNKYVGAAGVDGSVGVEWKLPRVPLLLSVDFHPFFDLNYTNQPDWMDFGLSLRYLF